MRCGRAGGKAFRERRHPGGVAPSTLHESSRLEPKAGACSDPLSISSGKAVQWLSRMVLALFKSFYFYIGLPPPDPGPGGLGVCHLAIFTIIGPTSPVHVHDPDRVRRKSTFVSKVMTDPYSPCVVEPDPVHLSAWDYKLNCYSLTPFPLFCSPTSEPVFCFFAGPFATVFIANHANRLAKAEERIAERSKLN